jgi:hypothetical protein
VSEPDESFGATVAGVPIGIKGVNMAVVAILAVALAVILYMVMVRSAQEHSEIGGNLKDIGELLEEQNYIVLSDERERQDIKKQLRRPPSLLKKMERR